MHCRPVAPLVTTLNAIKSALSGEFFQTRSCTCTNAQASYTLGVCTAVPETAAKTCDTPLSGYSCMLEACSCLLCNTCFNLPCPGAYTRSCGCPTGYESIGVTCKKDIVSYSTTCDAPTTGGRLLNQKKKRLWKPREACSCVCFHKEVPMSPAFEAVTQCKNAWISVI